MLVECNLRQGGREKPELGRGDRQPCLSPELSELRAYQTYVQMCSRVIGPLYNPPSLEQWRLNQARALSRAERTRKAVDTL